MVVLHDDILKVYEFTGAETGEIKFTWTQTSSKALYIKSINIEYEKEVAADAVDAPVFSVEGGVKEEAFNLELTCATADAEIYYTLNGGEETKYTAAINIATTTTVKAWAVKGDKKSDEVTATYTFIEYIENATIAQVLAAEPSDYVWYKMTGVIDSLYNTTYGNFYFVDGQDTIIVYGLTATKVASNDKSFASLNLVEGDKITIWGTRSAFNGNPQVGGPAYFVEKVEEPVEPTPTIVEGTKLYIQLPATYTVVNSSVTFGEKATGGKLSPVKRGMSIGGGTIGGGTTTGTAMTNVDAENGVWEVVAPAGTSDSLFSVAFSFKGYTAACNIANLKYDGEHNLFTLSSDFAFDIRRGGTATEANGTWGVYPFPEPGITATWSIEEGAELESFTEVTITFTGVEAANTITMYPVCFYKVAADGTTTPVANDCTAGLLNRKASGASITLMVQEDEYDFCYDGKITAGNYRIVLSAGMVKFNNDNTNKNTEDYVLNFSIKGSDTPALEEIDAVYTVNPENNAIVTEIREIVLNFTGYETIAVAEPDMATGRNIPTVYFEDELTGSMMPAGYIMFKADTASANGLRLYVDPMYTGGEESFAREGKYVVRIPAGVVTFGTTGISKEIVLNYTVGKVQSGEVTTMVELKANEGKRVLYKGLEPAKVTIGGGWGSYTEYFMPDSVTVLNYLGNVIPAKMDVYGTYNSAYVADEWSEATPTFVVDSVVAIYAFNNMGDLVDFVENEATDEQKMGSYEIKEPVVVTMASMFSFYVQYEAQNMMGRSSWQGLMVQAGRMSMYQSKAGDAIQIKGSYSPAVYDENDVMQRPAYFALETATVVSENNKLNYASIDLSSYGLKYVSEYYASLGRLSKGGKIAEDDYGYYYVISYVDYVENPETNMYDEVLVTDSLKLMVAGPVDLSAYVGKDLDKLVAGVIDFDPSEGAPVFYVTELQESKLYYNTIAELLAAGAQTDYTMSSALRNPVLLTYISHNQFAGYTIFVQDSTGAIAIKGLGEADEMGEYTAPFPYDVVAGDSIKGVEGFTTFGDAAAFMWSGDEYVSNLKLEKVSKGVVEPIDITLAEFNADVALVQDAIMMGDFYLSKYANKVVRVKGLTRTDDPEDEKWPWLVQGEDSIKVSTYYWGRIAVPYAITSLTGIADYTIINGQTASIQPLNAESVVAGSGVKVEYVTLADLYTENGLIVVDDEFQIFTITGQNVTDMNGNLPSGVYVVRTATAVGKVVVK